MARALVTGATGFVGGHLIRALQSAGFDVRAAVRNPAAVLPAAVEGVPVSDIGPDTDWTAALQGVDVIVHAAARAHVLNAPASDAHLYFRCNAEGTRRLARSAADAGVKRLVLVSSIKADVKEDAAADPYGTSKQLGERHLQEVARGSGMEGVIVRPPLVYGPGVRANFLRMMRWVDRGWPLPLASIDNRRSLVNVWNLADIVATLARHPGAGGAAWSVSDGEDLSTPELLRRLAAAMGRNARLLPVSAGLLRLGGRLLGRTAEIDRLCGSLVVDITAARRDLGWRPVVSMEEGLARTVAWYRQVHGR